MDWVRTQTVSVFLEDDDVVRLDCGLNLWFQRFWDNMISLCLLIFGLSGLALGLTGLFPRCERVVTWVFLHGGCFPCMAGVGAGELIALERAMPWNPPGKVFHLFRQPHSDLES